MSEIWTVLNSPLPILLIGSGLAWVFAKFWFEPWQEARRSRQHRKEMVRELLSRLRLAIQLLRLSKDPGTYDNRLWARLLLEGDKDNTKAFVNPDYAGWSLLSLLTEGELESVVTAELIQHIRVVRESSMCHPKTKEQEINRVLPDTIVALEKLHEQIVGIGVV